MGAVPQLKQRWPAWIMSLGLVLDEWSLYGVSNGFQVWGYVVLEGLDLGSRAWGIGHYLRLHFCQASCQVSLGDFWKAYPQVSNLLR